MRQLLAIPVYNEKNTVEAVLMQALEYVGDVIEEILVVVDGSTDGSGELVRKLIETHPRIHAIFRKKNAGYGASIIASLHYGKTNAFDYVITMDCDLQHRPEDLHRFADYAAEIDVVSGSRYLAKSGRIGQAPPDRVEINERITKRINKRFGWQLTDAFCGFKRFRLAGIEPSRFQEYGYAFPMEFWAYAWTQGLSVAEIPVSRIYVTDDRSFGEDLDKKRKRYHYYLKTLHRAEKQFRKTI